MSVQAVGQYEVALSRTAWGRRARRRFALMDGAAVLASAETRDYAGTLDGRSVRICGIGDVVTSPGRDESQHARTLVEALVEEAARAGTDLALLCARPGLGAAVSEKFESLPLSDLTLRVAESPRHGAPMTLVRGGEDRDLAAIVAMGRIRAETSRLHLDRDEDLVQDAVTRQRLLAGLAPSGVRQLHFFIAEEGITAAAYVVISVVGHTWTIEECGDRDVSGARVGALLQALIAREPAERRPVIGGWLPPGFLPPQVAIAAATPARDAIWVRTLGPGTPPLRLSGDDVLYWHGDR
jgi:hypothetical protein